MLRRTLLSSLLQTALLGAAGGIGSAPGKAAARNNARSAPVEECEADLVIVGSGAAGLSAGLAALEAGVRKVVILEKAAIAGGHTMLASGSVSAVFGADVDKLIDAMLTAGAGENNPALVETLARQSGAAFEWLAEHGVNWMKTPYRAVGSPGAWSYSTGFCTGGLRLCTVPQPRLPSLGRAHSLPYERIVAPLCGGGIFGRTCALSRCGHFCRTPGGPHAPHPYAGSHHCRRRLHG